MFVGYFRRYFLMIPHFRANMCTNRTGKPAPFPKSKGRKDIKMKAEEMDIVMDAVHNALEAVRCLGELEKKSNVILISQNDLKAYLGGDLEGKLVEAYKILETEISGES